MGTWLTGVQVKMQRRGGLSLPLFQLFYEVRGNLGVISGRQGSSGTTLCNTALRSVSNMSWRTTETLFVIPTALFSEQCGSVRSLIIREK